MYYSLWLLTMPLSTNIAVFRKTESNLFPFYSRRKGSVGGTLLTRKPSMGSMRPFLHQYEVKLEGSTSPSSQPNSAPTSPVKSKESVFKRRSLSFGAGPVRKQLPKRPHAESSLVTTLMPSQKKSAVFNIPEPVPTTGDVATPSSPSFNPPSSTAPAAAKCVLARPCESRT